MTIRVLEQPATAPPATDRLLHDRVVAHSGAQKSLRLPWLERWHLLSLDAPSLATLWTWFLTRCAGSHATAPTLFAMFLAVWVLYAADRLLDARAILTQADPSLEARHYFHARHRRAFVIAIAIAAPALLSALAAMAHPLLLAYIALAVLLALWLAIIHTSRTPARLPKELAVGLFFAVAVGLPAAFAGNLIVLLPCAMMASLNCLFLLDWERRPETRSTIHASAAFAIRRLESLCVTAMLACIAFAARPTFQHHPSAALPPLICALSVALLLLLHRTRHRFTPTTLRALADAALLTPLLTAPLLSYLAR